MNKGTLLIGPWVGEFGWELFCWQGYVRNFAKNYDYIIILCRKGNEFLYSDFANEIIEFDSPASKANMFKGEIDYEKLEKIVNHYKPDKHLKPFNIGISITKNGVQISEEFNNQKFIKYKSNSLIDYVDIILHPRNREIGSDRNWNEQKWQYLIDMLNNANFKVAIIGKEETHSLNNIIDYRNIPIKDLVSLFNRCKLVAGPSSGPLHLASLSGAPHLVWSEEFNRIRYENIWNPLKTPVYFYGEEGWNPEVENIYNKILKII